MTIEVRKLAPDDDRSTFRSGDAELDRFFLHYAGQNQFRHHIGTTYIAVETGILGFATVSMSEILPTRMPTLPRKRLPRYPLPALRLARLAVGESAKGRGVGGLLLRSVMALAAQLADDVGCIGVVVDAKPKALGFYERFGFVRLEIVAGELGDRPQPVPMFRELAGS